MMPKKRVDISKHVDYMPPAFTREQKMLYPDENGDYYFDDEGLPVNLTDDMVLRAHYLDLGISHLLQKYREGALSDQEYIQFHRMNGELRGILQHLWEMGKRALYTWVDSHIRGGNPNYDIGISDVEQLLDTLKELGLPARPALTLVEQALGYDMEDDLKRSSIGAPLLRGDYEYEDEDEEEQFDEALSMAGVDDIDDVQPSDENIWDFIKEQLDFWVDPKEIEELRKNPDVHRQKPYIPMKNRKVAPWGIDARNPDEFLNGDRDSEYDEEISNLYRGYLNAEEYEPSPHVNLFADLRRHPQYEASVDDMMARKWDPVNDMIAHRQLLSELDIDEDEWAALDTQTQMALISRLLQAQHRSGNIITDKTPSFQFQSGLYEPRGNWVDWKMGDAPSLESGAVRDMLDDLNQSPMVESWDRMMREFPHERWSSVGPMVEMTRMSTVLDHRGQSDLADRLDRLAFG